MGEEKMRAIIEKDQTLGAMFIKAKGGKLTKSFAGIFNLCLN